MDSPFSDTLKLLSSNEGVIRMKILLKGILMGFITFGLSHIDHGVAVSMTQYLY